MTGPKAAAVVFPGVVRATRRRLRPLGLTPAPVPPDLVARAAGRVRLSAARWLVGPAGRPVADCRLVRIAGGACEVANTLIFPADPARVPVFAAELVGFGGRPRVAFLDLQTPGLDADRRPAVGRLARAAAGRHPDLPRDPAPPAWAVADSAGGHLFTRTTDSADAPALARAYRDYLAAWAAVARAAGPADPGRTGALAGYLRTHLAEYPGRPFLDKVFGPEWADRFLREFLYRCPDR